MLFALLFILFITLDMLASNGFIALTGTMIYPFELGVGLFCFVVILKDFFNKRHSGQHRPLLIVFLIYLLFSLYCHAIHSLFMVKLFPAWVDVSLVHLMSKMMLIVSLFNFIASVILLIRYRTRLSFWLFNSSVFSLFRFGLPRNTLFMRWHGFIDMVMIFGWLMAVVILMKEDLHTDECFLVERNSQKNLWRSTNNFMGL